MEQDFRIYAKGEAFTDGIYDLRTLETLISNYRKILDRLVAVQLGKKQVTPELLSQLDYNVQVKSGSIELLVNFALEHREYFAALAADGGQALSKAIVILFRDAITLREKAAELIKKGVTVNINISNSLNAFTSINNTNVSYDNNSGNIYINDPKILFAAQLTRTPVNSILNKVDGKSLEFVEINSASDEYRLTETQKVILGQEKEELTTTLKIVGRLDMVAFTSHRGDIISDGQRFSVTWDNGIRSKMQRIGDIEGIVFTVRPIIDRNRLDSETIGFHVLDCHNPQTKLGI